MSLLAPSATELARASFRAVGLDARTANILIYGLGIMSPHGLRAEPWEDIKTQVGLETRLRSLGGVGELTMARIRSVWQTGDASGPGGSP